MTPENDIPARAGLWKQYNLCWLATLAVILTSCVTPAKKMQTISLGMSKEQIVAKLGDPAVARGAIRNKFNQVVEVWQYRFALPSDDSAGQVIGKSFMTLLTLGIAAEEFRGKRKDYWLYFMNNELVQWGEAGDWRQEADRIYEVRFENGQKIQSP